MLIYKTWYKLFKNYAVKSKSECDKILFMAAKALMRFLFLCCRFTVFHTMYNHSSCDYNAEEGNNYPETIWNDKHENKLLHISVVQKVLSTTQWSADQDV